MISDSTTFFLAFAAIFIAFGVFLWRLDRHARRLEFRIQVLEEQESGASGGAEDATPKNQSD